MAVWCVANAPYVLLSNEKRFLTTLKPGRCFGNITSREFSCMFGNATSVLQIPPRCVLCRMVHFGAVLSCSRCIFRFRMTVASFICTAAAVTLITVLPPSSGVPVVNRESQPFNAIRNYLDKSHIDDPSFQQAQLAFYDRGASGAQRQTPPSVVAHPFQLDTFSTDGSRTTRVYNLGEIIGIEQELRKRGYSEESSSPEPTDTAEFLFKS